MAQSVLASHRALISAMVLGVAAAATSAGDWPQFQYDAASHGRAPKAVEPPYQLRWVWYGPGNIVQVGRPVPAGRVPRPPREPVGRLSFTMHAVVADGRVVFGDLDGALYALNTRTGQAVWTRQFPGAFVHAEAIWQGDEDPAHNVIIAPCQDGRIYGLDWRGRDVWQVRTRRPIVTPAKLDGNTAYVGSLDGVMYAVDVPTGKIRWRYDAGAAIRQPAAVLDGRVFFGSENMVFHAADARTGRGLWKSAKGLFTGQSFRNTWPVAVGDKVMTFQVLVDGLAEFVMEALLFNATPGGADAKRLEDWPAERKAILGWLAGDRTWAVDCRKGWQSSPGQVIESSRSPSFAGGPMRKTFYVLNAAGDRRGRAVEPYQVPMGIVGGTGNANMGPVLDARGRPVTWWRVSARSIITGGSFGTSFCPDLSALDLTTGDRIILPTTRNNRRGGPGMELDNHHMLTAAGDYIYYNNPFRQARWVRLDGRQNPTGSISAVYGRHDGGGWSGDVVYYPTKEAAGARAEHVYDSHGAARTPIVIADDALFLNEIDIRALACYESRTGRNAGADPPERPARAVRPIAAPGPASSPAVQHDLADYVWQRRVVSDIPAGATGTLRRRLAEHVEGMLAAGHLLPYYGKRGEQNPRWYFTNPGQTVAALARALPYLPAEMRPRVLAWLRKETAAYPPCGERLNAPSDGGARRMDFAVPQANWRWNPKFYAALPRVQNVYAVWLYATAGDAEYARRNWDGIKAFYAAHRGDITASVSGVSAPIGLARLARLTGDVTTERQALADAAEAFRALDRPADMQPGMSKRWGFGARWQGSFVPHGFHLLGLTPEVARYIREHPAAYADVTRTTAHLTDEWPMWFISQASGFSRYYGESHALPPVLSAMVFPVKALAEQSPPDKLAVWADAEDAPRGDLFYIRRLVLAIESTGKVAWAR